MTFHEQIQQELLAQSGLQTEVPKTLTLKDDNGGTLNLDLLIVDQLSCAAQEIRLEIPALPQTAFATLKAWADEISQKVTYLLESMAPFELDDQSNQVMLRSVPPAVHADGPTFYECLISQIGQGITLKLARFCAEKKEGSTTRTQVAMQFTHETVQKLIRDIEDILTTTVS